MTDISAAKARLEQTLRSITAKHLRGAAGTATASALASRLDTLVKDIYAQSANPHKKQLAVFALGGYGRRELCFASDTDVMFLVRDDAQKSHAEPTLKELLHTLLDCGLEIGHSFRTVSECVTFAERDFETWTSLLDARFICGNRPLSAELFRALKIHSSKMNKSAFVRLLLQSVEQRHRKYGTSTKLLEPNVKNSAGGLRDLHALLWLLSGIGSVPLHGTSRSTQPSISMLLKSPQLKKIVSSQLLSGTRNAFDFLLRARNEMHLQAQGLHDTLEFASQRRVADALGMRSVEHFMQQYYIAARAVSLLAKRVSGWAEHTYCGVPRGGSEKQIHPKFRLRNGAIELRSPSAAFTTLDILTAGRLWIEHNAPFSTSLEDRILRASKALQPIRSREAALVLRRMMNAEHGLGTILQRFNDLGVLARLIPEWKPMVAFFQHNLYHYYTADEHTLTVVANAEALSQADSEVGTVFRKLPRRDTLYFACLFHDIAKPVNAANHERAGAKIAKTILKRLGAKDIADDVLFLVRTHLSMEQAAFRRNLSDPETIIEFAKQFSAPEQLDYLYVLTYADLSAVNKNVWTDWKGMLLSELYRKTRDLLTGATPADRLHKTVEFQRADAHEEIIRSLSGKISSDNARRHLESIDSTAYLTAFRVEEIAEHIRAIHTRELTTAMFKHRHDVTEVTVIAQDAPFALSKFCGVLTANDANILDANIFTRSDGVILDKFRVTNSIHKSSLTAAQCEKIQADLADVFRGSIDIEHLLQRHRMKWKRRTQQRNPNVRVDVEFEDHPRYTIVDVYAFDMLGFLYTITGALSQLGLNIAFAKIATRADGIVDSFYVTDLTGSKLDSQERRAKIKAELLSAIQKLAQTELVTTSL